MNAVVIIPTIDPDERLATLIDELRIRGFSRFIVVDDGSDATHDELFERLERGSVRVMHHATNLGKGAAIKTALATVRRMFPEATHVVTVDGDGQHLPDDVLRVCKAAEGHPAGHDADRHRVRRRQRRLAFLNRARLGAHLSATCAVRGQLAYVLGG